MKNCFRILALVLFLCMLVPLLVLSIPYPYGTDQDDPPLIEEYYRTDLPLGEGRTSPIYRTAVAANLPADVEVLTSEKMIQGGLIPYRDAAGTLGVYNLDLDRTVASFAPEDLRKEEPIRTLSCCFLTYAEKNGDVTTSLYDVCGNHLATADGVVAPAIASEETIHFAGWTFLLSGTEVVARCAPDARKDLRLPLVRTDELFFYLDARRVFAYDQKLSILATLEAPAYAEGVEFWVLDSGEILMEYLVEVDPLAQRYDILTNGVKLLFHHVLWNPHTDRQTEIFLGVDVVSVCNRYQDTALVDEIEFSNLFTDRVKNCLLFDPIEEGQWNPFTPSYAVLSNEGKLGVRLDRLIDGQKGLCRPIGHGLFSVSTEEKTLTVNAKGEILADAPEGLIVRDYGFVFSPESLAWGDSCEGKLYDRSMKKCLADLLPLAEGEEYLGANFRSYYVGFIWVKSPTKGVRAYVLDRNGVRPLTPPRGYTFRGFWWENAYDSHGTYVIEYYPSHLPQVSNYHMTVDICAYDGSLLYTADWTNQHRPSQVFYGSEAEVRIIVEHPYGWDSREVRILRLS